MAEETAPTPAPEPKPAAAAQPAAETKPAAEAKAEPHRPTAAEMLAPDSAPTDTAPKRRQKGAKHVPLGVVHIRSTFNNTMVAITDTAGNLISWGSGGRSGFKGSRKSTAFAATVITQEAARQAAALGMHEVEVKVQGPGAGRESAVRALQSAGLTVTSIKDVTPIPHNGCRPRKRRRV